MLEMSAKPGRYSSDLRWRIIWQRTVMDLKLHVMLRVISRNLGISLGTGHNVWKCFELTGDVTSTRLPVRYESRSLTEQHKLLVVTLVIQDPSMYLREMCDKILEITGIRVSASTCTLCRILHRHSVTRKKIKQTSIQRCALFRGDVMAEIHLYDASQIVWVDESVITKIIYESMDIIMTKGYMYPEIQCPCVLFTEDRGCPLVQKWTVMKY